MQQHRPAWQIAQPERAAVDTPQLEIRRQLTGLDAGAAITPPGADARFPRA